MSSQQNYQTMLNAFCHNNGVSSMYGQCASNQPHYMSYSMNYNYNYNYNVSVSQSNGNIASRFEVFDGMTNMNVKGITGYD